MEKVKNIVMNVEKTYIRKENYLIKAVCGKIKLKLLFEKHQIKKSC